MRRGGGGGSGGGGGGGDGGGGGGGRHAPDLETLGKCTPTRGGVWAPIRQAVWVGLGARQGSAAEKLQIRGKEKLPPRETENRRLEMPR